MFPAGWFIAHLSPRLAAACQQVVVSIYLNALREPNAAFTQRRHNVVHQDRLSPRCNRLLTGWIALVWKLGAGPEWRTLQPCCCWSVQPAVVLFSMGETSVLSGTSDSSGWEIHLGGWWEWFFFFFFYLALLLINTAGETWGEHSTVKQAGLQILRLVKKCRCDFGGSQIPPLVPQLEHVFFLSTASGNYSCGH